MKLKTILRAQLALAALALGAMFAGCIPDTASWSPDGKSLTYVCAENGALESLDVQAGTSKQLFAYSRTKVVFCYNAGSSGAIFYATRRPGSKPDEPIHDLSLIDAKGIVTKDLAKDVCVEAGMASAADGSRSYFIKNDKDANTWELWLVDPTAKEPQPKRVYSQTAGFGYPCASADGKRVLITFDATIGVLDTDTGAVRHLIHATKVLPAIYGVWGLNESVVAYLITYERKGDPNAAASMGELATYSMADGKIRRLGAAVPIMRRPMPGAGGASVYVTEGVGFKPESQVEMDQVPIEKYQVCAYDLKTGERRIVTDEPNGAFWPFPDPSGERLAYYTAKLGTRGGNPDELILKLGKAKGGPGEVVKCAKH